MKITRIIRLRYWETRGAIRSWWWIRSGYAARIEAENKRLRETIDFRTKQFVEARDALWRLENLPTGKGGALLLAADEVDHQDATHRCESAWQEYDTGAWNCDRDGGPDQVCWCMVADELRELEKALRVKSEYAGSVL